MQSLFGQYVLGYIHIDQMKSACVCLRMLLNLTFKCISCEKIRSLAAYEPWKKGHVTGPCSKWSRTKIPQIEFRKHVHQNIITTSFVPFVFLEGSVSDAVLIVFHPDALGCNSILDVMIASKWILNVVIANFMYNHVRNDNRQGLGQ